MQCNATQRNAMQCNAMQTQRNATQYNTIQYNTIQYNTIQYNTIQYNTIQYNTIQYNTIQYNTIQYNTIQYNTIQYNTIQCNAMQCNAIQYSIWTLKSVQCSQTSSQSYNIILYGTDFKAHILPVWWASGVKYFRVFNSGLRPLLNTGKYFTLASSLYRNSIWTLKYVQCAQTSSPSYNIILYGTDFKAHILPVWWASGVKYFPVFNLRLRLSLTTGKYFTLLAHYTYTVYGLWNLYSLLKLVLQVTILFSIWTLKYVQCAQTGSPSYNIFLYGTDFKAHILPVWWASGVKYFPVFNLGLHPSLNTGKYFTLLAHYTDTVWHIFQSPYTACMVS